MEGDSLSIIGIPEAVHPAVDSSMNMLRPWSSSEDSLLFHGSGFWFQEVPAYFKQRDSFGMIRHQAVIRRDRMASESLLLALLLFECFLVAFLLKRGLKLISQYMRSPFSSPERSVSGENTTGFGFSVFLWILTMVVYSLMGHVLLNAVLGPDGYGLDSSILLRLFLYTFLFFLLQNFLFQSLGKVFFTPVQTSRWLSNNKTIQFFYAMTLSPVLIGAEIGVITNRIFIFYWTIAFLLISRIWMFSKTIRIFSAGNGNFFYLILYLCALEILPILLYYKGLFLL